MKKNNLPGKIVMLGSIYGSMIAQNEKNYKNTNVRNMTYMQLNQQLELQNNLHNIMVKIKS